MANPEKGEVSFEARGRTYTLIYSANAFCMLEAELDRGLLDIYAEIATWSGPTDSKGKPLPETPEQVFARVKKIRLGFCRAVFWAGLTDAQEGITLRDAGDLMKDLGGMSRVMDLIGEGVVAAQPAASEGEAAPGRPRKGAGQRRGTGRAS